MDHNYTYYRELQQNDVVLILGATHGDFMRERKNEILQKNVFVVNVEPTLEGVNSMSSFIKQHLPYNATIFSGALSDKLGIFTMDIRDNLITSTLEERPETNMRWPMPLLYKTRVITYSLDSLLEAIGKVDAIFCDIEGSELEVFGSSKLVKNVPYIAIAAYHIRDGVPTYSIMSKWEWGGHRGIVDGEPSQRKEEVLFFAIKE